ncbi:hypothetical protein ACCT28_28660 [Rhizobium ruizarguesonis]
MGLNHLSDDEVKAAHLAGGIAADDFRRTLAELVEEATAVDSLEFLARAVMMVTINGLNQPKPEDKSGLQLFQLELIQALALSRKHVPSDPNIDDPAVTERATNLIRQNAQAYQDQAKCKVSSDPEENRRQEMLNLTQRWTLAVRGARQGFQTREYAAGLATSVNGSFRHYYGCDATEVVAALSAIIDICQSRIEAHMEDMRSWMMPRNAGKGLFEAFTRNLDPDEKAEITSRAAAVRHDRQQLFALLWNINEQRWTKLFRFTYAEVVATAPADQMQAIISVLSQLSLHFRGAQRQIFNISISIIQYNANR